MSEIIPIMHCFDNNYVLPASVAFYSMLEHANPKYEYKLYVLHTDITLFNQNKLKQTIANFKNSSLEFINMNNKFDDLFSSLKIKGHFSKEVFYKILASSIFVQYEKIMIADVDVIYLNDIAENYVQFDLKDDVYLAAFHAFTLKGSWLEKCLIDDYKKDFLDEEIEKLKYGGGYYIFNLIKMRQEKIEQQFIDCSFSNVGRMRQLEQDIINLVCYPKIKPLPANSVVCTYMYDLYQTEKDFDNDLYYKASDIHFALDNPIQLHYATSTKPWKDMTCTKADIWFKYLTKTNFLEDFLAQIDNQLKANKKSKKILSFNLPFSKRKIEIYKEKIDNK